MVALDNMISIEIAEVRIDCCILHVVCVWTVFAHPVQNNLG